jgi:hypothetical protein
MRDATILMDTRAALDGMVTTRDITVITHHIMHTIAGAITRVIIHIIMHHRHHAERALRTISTITITMTTIGGTFGNKELPGQKTISLNGRDQCSLARVSGCAGRRPFYAANGMNSSMQRNSTFRLLKSVLLAMLLPAVCACGTEAWKRTGYETLQNIHQQQCEKTLSVDCGERKSYDAYQREVEELETNETPDPRSSRDQ